MNRAMGSRPAGHLDDPAGRPYPARVLTRDPVRETGGKLPAARLQSIPFPQPQRFITVLDDDLSVIEPGLRLAARDVPLPEDAGGGTIEALCADASGKAVALKIVERIEPRELFDALAARAWLYENLATLRAVCPALAG